MSGSLQRRFHFIAPGFVDQRFDQLQSEIHRGTGAARSDNRTIRDYGFFPDLRAAATYRCECAGIAGGLFSLQHPGLREYLRCGANRRRDFSLAGHTLNKVDQPAVCREPFSSRPTAWKYDHVEMLLEGFCQRGVGNQYDTAACGYGTGFKAGANDFDAGAAQQIDNGNGFEFFAAFRNGNEDACHKRPSMLCRLMICDTGTS